MRFRFVPFYFKSAFQWKRESQTTYCSRSIKEYHEWMTAPFITVKLFPCCEQVVSLETTPRPELIPGYQAWTSVPELPLSRWENLINTFQKSNSYHLLKICIRSQDWYFGARSINSQKRCSETKVTLAIKNGFQTASSRMKKNHFIGNLSYGATGNKSNKLIEF